MTNLPCPIAAQASQSPDNPAIIWADGQLSYAELHEITQALAATLSREGVKSGGRVGVMADGHWQVVVLFWALFRLNAVVVPVNTRWPAAQALERLREVHCTTVIDESGEHGDLSLTHLFANLNRSTQSDDIRYAADQEATILFSSGSTGKPKAILQSWGNHYYSALGSNQNIVLAGHDRWLMSLPMYHVAGIGAMFRCFLAGASLYFAEKTEGLAEALRSGRLTHASMVATQLHRLINEVGEMSCKEAFPALKAILLGGSAIPVSLIREAFDYNWPIFTTYGMTEMASQITTTPADSRLSQLLTSGKLLPHREVKITDGGEVHVRGLTRFKGYVTEKGLDLPFDEAGWYDTGDLGVWDKEGYLLIKGRKDNMFISGGENIHPEEIETALEKFDGITMAYVVPVSDSEFGKRPVAFLDFEPALDIMPSRSQLEAFLAGKIARFMLPVAYYSLADLDVEKGIKISRAQLRQEAERRKG